MFSVFRLTLLGVVLLCAHPAGALGRQQDASPGYPSIPLDSVVALARAHNATLRVDRLGVQAMRERPDVVRARPDPMAGVTILPTPPSPWLGFQRSQWRLEQELMYPGKRSLMGRMAELEADEMAAGVDAMALDVEMEVSMAYYDLVRATRQIQLLRSFQDDLRAFEDIASAHYEVGEGSQGEILMAQLERAQMDLQVERWLQDRRSAAERLAWLINTPEGIALANEDPLMPELPSEMPSADELAALALRVHPEAAALRLGIEMGDAEIERARLEGRPDFMAMAMVGISNADMPSMAGEKATLGLGVQVNLPVWKDKLRAAREEARVGKVRAQARLEEFEIRVRTTIADLLQQVESRRRQLQQLEEVLLPQAETTREAALSAYTTGRGDFMDLLEVERMRFMLRMERVDLDAMLRETVARLEQAVGAGSLDFRF